MAGKDLRAAVEGFGITLLPDPFTAPCRQAGKLQFVLEELIGGEALASLVYPERDFMPPQVRAFIEHTTIFYRDKLIAIDIPIFDELKGLKNMR